MATTPQTQPVTEMRQATCEDCFFRRAELCALAGNTVCPTFRPAAEAAAPAAPKRLRAVYA
jgi:hypothetical protein